MGELELESKNTSRNAINSQEGPLADSELRKSRQKQKEQDRVVKFATTFLVRLVYISALLYISYAFMDSYGNIYKEDIVSTFAGDDTFAHVRV